MKLLAPIILFGVLLSIPVAPVNFVSGAADTCACPATMKCPDGCVAICQNGECHANCIGKDSSISMELFRMPITLQLIHGSSKQLASKLTSVTGKEVVFLPSKSDDAINLNIKNAPLWDVLETLSESGKVQIGGEDFSRLQTLRRALMADEKVSMCIHNAPLLNVANELSGLSGLPLRITSGDAKTLLTLTVEESTLKEIVAQISAQTGVQIATK